MTRSALIVLWLGSVLAAFSVGQCSGYCQRNQELSRVMTEADRSHERETQCLSLLERERSVLGRLMPVKGGVGGP